MVGRLAGYWRNDLRRLRAVRRAWRTMGMGVERWRLSGIRALMDLQVVRPKSELLDYNPKEEGYQWVLISKPQPRRWF